MVSTHPSYLRGISPPKYRRQTLEIFDIYADNRRDHPVLQSPRTVSPDRKWIHRSLGDLTADTNLIESHPRLQSEFYQDLFQKYPQAFARRRNAREAGRKLFNSRPHVRFEDEEKSLTQKSRSFVDLNQSHGSPQTNWDREVGLYIRNNSRECFTSVEPSECSGSVLSLKQRLHINSVTLNKLLNEKSPLRKKFERDRIPYDSGTENEQTLEEYFLDKSKQRSRNRAKHRRVVQRRITNNSSGNDDETAKHRNRMAHQRWMSKSTSPIGRHMYSLPMERDEETIRQNIKQMDVDSVMRNSDLKIDTLLEKISSKMCGPESPPDSAIDVDTPSVQSFVSSDRVMTSDNVYQVSIDLSADEKAGDFDDSHSSPESSPSLYGGNYGMGHLRGNGNQSAISTSNSVSHEGHGHIPHQDYRHDDCLRDVSMETTGLLQLYSDHLMPHATNKNLHSDTETLIDRSHAEHMGRYEGSSVDVPRHETGSNLHDDGVKGQNNHENVTQRQAAQIEEHTAKEFTGTSIQEKERNPGRPPRGRQKKKQKTVLHSGLPSGPDRSDVDTCILDEVQLEGTSHDLEGRGPLADNVDDTDVRLGIPKVTSRESKIAEKYHRTRSPSPFVVRNRNSKIPTSNRPKSAPVFREEIKDIEMRIVDIPLSNSRESCEFINQPNTHVDAHVIVCTTPPLKCESKTCHEKDILGNIDNDITGNMNNDIQGNMNNNDIPKHLKNDIPHQGQLSNMSKDDRTNLENSSCVQKCDSEISVSSTYAKHRNDIAMATANVVSMETDSFKNKNDQIHQNDSENTSFDNGDISEKFTEEESCNKGYYSDQNIPGDNMFMSNSAERHKNNDIDTNEDRNQRTQIISARKGFYTPSVTSPRTNEKRQKLRSLLKTKKGSYSPAPTGTGDDQMGNVTEYQSGVRGQREVNGSSTVGNHVQRPNPEEPVHSYNGLHGQNFEDETADQQVNHNGTPAISDRLGDRLDDTASVSDAHPDDNRLAHTAGNGDSDSESDVQTVRSKYTVNNSQGGPLYKYTENNGQGGPLSKYTENNDQGRPLSKYTENDGQGGPLSSPAPASASTSNESLPRLAKSQESLPSLGADILASSRESLPKNTNIPPAKPARAKHKKLPADLNLSQYKIMPSINGQQSNPESNGQPAKSQYQGDNRQPIQQTQPQNNVLETIGPQNGNPDKSKGMFGGFKSATKDKLRSFKKAMSLDKGMDKAGVITFPDPHQQANGKMGDNSGLPKMKKAPSIKSITSLFGRKKKKGKMNSEGIEISSVHGSRLSLSSAQTSNPDGQQPGTSRDKPGTSSSRPMGKLQGINPDGTQLVQLVKPQNGPIGFFIAKGSARYKNGIFISRFIDPQPEKIFGGLLSVGDEILEVNGHFVRDLSQDDVYDIISASPIVVLKVFPFIARKDI